MAEALLNHWGKNRYQAVSAGAKPAGAVHPLAIRALKEAGLPTEGLRPKSWEEFKDRPVDIVVTVCDNAKESCPIWPGHPATLHWSLEDPAEATGGDEEKMNVFRKTFSKIQNHIQSFLLDSR